MGQITDLKKSDVIKSVSEEESLQKSIDELSNKHDDSFESFIREENVNIALLNLKLLDYKLSVVEDEDEKEELNEIRKGIILNTKLI